MQFKAEFTLAAEAQAAVVCPVTQNTDLLTAPVVASTRIAGWGKHTYYDTRSDTRHEQPFGGPTVAIISESCLQSGLPNPPLLVAEL